MVRSRDRKLTMRSHFVESLIVIGSCIALGLCSSPNSSSDLPDLLQGEENCQEVSASQWHRDKFTDNHARDVESVYDQIVLWSFKGIFGRANTI